MPDITKCFGGDCPYKEKCYRYTSEPSYYQSYFTVEPFMVVGKQFKCEMIWTQESQSIWEKLNEIVNNE